jgi:hypothetical protein
MTQGVAGLSYIIIPYINESLLATAIIMFSGIVVLNWNSYSPAGVFFRETKTT